MPKKYRVIKYKKRYYNDKYKVWVEVNCTNNVGKNIDNEIISSLKKEYIQNTTH